MTTTKVTSFDDAVQAIITGDAETLKALLAAEPSLIKARSSSEHHATLLHYVGANGVEDELQKSPSNAPEIAQILIDAGAEVDALAGTYGGGSSQTTLALLVSSGHPAEMGVQADLVKILCDAGAAVNGLDDDGMPLATAITFGYPQAGEMLAECGARVDNIIFAAALGRLEEVKSYLTDEGKLRPDVEPYIIKSMANAEGWTGTALRPFKEPDAILGQALVVAANHNRLDVVKFLLEKGVNANASLNFGDTALHQSAAYGHLDVVKALVEHGADVNLRDDRFESTPVEWADHVGEDEVANYLLDHTPIDLQTAATFGRIERVKAILSSKGESPNGNNNAGVPLRVAARFGHIEIVQLLLENGADATLTNAEGKTALDWARENEHDEVVEILSQYVG